MSTDGDDLIIGATTRHADLAASALVRAEAPLLAYAAALVGDPQIRHRGTIGGSLSHADPAADLPMALRGAGRFGARCRAPAAAAGQRGRLLQGSSRRRWNRTSCSPRCAFRGGRRPLGLPEVRPPRQRLGDRRCRRGGGRIALANMGPTPLRARAAEAALAAGASAADAAALAADGT